MVLRQGEVSNAFISIAIPRGPIAAFRLEADVVEKNAQGEFVPVPLYDAYLHHHVIGSTHEAYKKQSDKWAPMKPQSFTRSVGFAAGTESRGTPQQFQYHEWLTNVHIINTRKLPVEKAHRCLECQCTSEDVITTTTVNAMVFAPHACNAELRAENNTACAATTYHGGLRCCEDDSFCLERSDVDMDDVSTYYLRYTIEYSDVVSGIRPLYLAGCCDASGDLTNHGNIEFDVPACDPEIHSRCVHTLSTLQRVDLALSSVFSLLGAVGSDVDAVQPDHEVELVYAVGHQHRAGLGVSIFNDATGDLICSSVPMYGKSGVIGDEKDYVVAMSTCTFDPPLRMKASDVIRVVSLYNNTEPHTGVTSIMYLAVSDMTTAATTVNAASVVGSGLFSSPVVVAALVGVVVVAVVGAAVVIHQRRRSGYVSLARPSDDAE